MKANCTRAEWSGRALCGSCEVRAFVLTSGLAAPALDTILRAVENLQLPQHGTLYRQATPAPYVYTVRSGVIKLTLDQPNGAQRIVRLLRPGDIVGMEALVDRAYHHTATAMRAADVCRIPREVVLQLDESNPGVHQSLMRRWQCSLDQADAFIVSLSTGPAEARMARLLLMLGCSGGAADGMPSREEMGALLGITTETASRVVADFKRRGLIRTHNGSVECDPRALDGLASA